MTDREGHKEGWGEGGGKEEREGREGEGERGRERVGGRNGGIYLLFAVNTVSTPLLG